jgi:hypothetical protein
MRVSQSELPPAAIATMKSVRVLGLGLSKQGFDELAIVRRQSFDHFLDCFVDNAPLGR